MPPPSPVLLFSLVRIGFKISTVYQEGTGSCWLVVWSDWCDAPERVLSVSVSSHRIDFGASECESQRTISYFTTLLLDTQIVLGCFYVIMVRILRYFCQTYTYTSKPCSWVNIQIYGNAVGMFFFYHRYQIEKLEIWIVNRFHYGTPQAVSFALPECT